MHSKKSDVPEYIWYISLIIIAITLVVGVANIAKKANKNIEPPSNLNVQFDVIIDPNNIVKIKTLEFIGDFDLEKDAPNLYLKCGNSYENLMKLFNTSEPTQIFTRKATGSIGLKDFDGLILKNKNDTNSSIVKKFPLFCFQKDGVWEIYYGNPDEGGVMLAQDKVDRKWGLS
jgi:hypothetical protein